MLCRIHIYIYIYIHTYIKYISEYKNKILKQRMNTLYAIEMRDILLTRFHYFTLFVARDRERERERNREGTKLTCQSSSNKIYKTHTVL